MVGNNSGTGISLRTMAEGLKTLRDSDLRDDLKKIKIPTLILHCKLDKIFSYDLAKQMNKLLSSSTLVSLEKVATLYLQKNYKNLTLNG